MFRLTVKKGSFFYDQQLGSRLYTLKGSYGSRGGPFSKRYADGQRGAETYEPCDAAGGAGQPDRPGSAHPDCGAFGRPEADGIGGAFMSETYESILSRMQGRFQELAGFQADDASDIGIRLKVLAGEIFSAYTNLDWLQRQVFPQTAQGSQLDYHAQQRGIQRKSAVCSQGMLEFSREAALLYDVTIPEGTVCATSQEGGATVSHHTERDSQGGRFFRFGPGGFRGGRRRRQRGGWHGQGASDAASRGYGGDQPRRFHRRGRWGNRPGASGTDPGKLQEHPQRHQQRVLPGVCLAIRRGVLPRPCRPRARARALWMCMWLPREMSPAVI